MTAPNTHVPAGTNDDGTIVVTPSTGAPIGVAAASERARELLRTTGTALPAETPAAPAAPAAPLTPTQPRASDGTFGTPLPADPNVPAPAPVAPEAGQAPPADAPPASEGERTPEEIAADEARQARLVTIELGEGEAVDLEVQDPAVAERVRAITETAREAATIRTEAEAQIADALAIRDFAEIDPVGFAERALRDSPAGQDHLVLSLLTRPEVFERLKPTLAAIVNDPNELRTVAAEQKAARGEYRDQAQHARAEQAAVRENLAEVQATCAAMARLIPNPAAADVAYNDFLRDLQSYVQHANLNVIPPQSIPVVLTGRLTALGIDPMVAAQAAQQALAQRAKGRPVSPPAARPRATASATPRPASPPRSAPTGQAFVASAQQRRSVAAIPPAGAGSPSVGPDLVPPKKADGSPMGIAESVAWHREQNAKGKHGLVPAT